MTGTGAPPGPPAAAHVFVEDLSRPELNDDDAHHLGRVRRLRDGEVVTASDGRSSWLPCRVVGTGGGLRLAPDGPVVVEATVAPPLTVAFAVPKGDRPEWAVQKLTEIGVDRILLLRAARSVVSWDGGRAERGLTRLRRVAREAAMQCRRVSLPEVGPVVTVRAALELAATAGVGSCLATPGGEPPTLARPFVLVGPEGGWDPAEAALGAATLGLGTTVLRSETAAVAAGVLLAGLRVGLVATAAAAHRP